MKSLDDKVLAEKYALLLKWYKGAKRGEIKEKPLEALIFYEIFREVLKWKNNVKGIETGRVITDLRLHLRRRNRRETPIIPVEIKSPKITKTAWNEGLGQVVGYCLELAKQSKIISDHGILTDGNRWFFVKINHKKQIGKIIGVWYLFDLLDKNKKVNRYDKIFFKFLRRNHIENLLKLFSDTFLDIGFKKVFKLAMEGASSQKKSLRSLLQKKHGVETTKAEADLICHIVKMIGMNDRIPFPAQKDIRPREKQSAQTAQEKKPAQHSKTKRKKK